MVLKREILLKKIADSLALLEISTRNRGILRFYDQHIIAETFAAKLLNIFYDYALINLNTIDPNYAATDLGDFHKRLCFQVTYTAKNNHRTKIAESITKFITHRRYEHFDTLKFLFLGPKQKKYTKAFDTKGFFTFSPYSDVINLQDLVDKLPTLTNQQIEKIVRLIDEEFCISSESLQETSNHQTDVGENHSEVPSKLLQQIFTIYHKELTEIKKNSRRPNGIALYHLGEISLNQGGDFRAAKEVFFSLIRLSAAWEEKGHRFSIKSPVPEATPIKPMIDLLKMFRKMDFFSLFHDVIRRLRLHALIGDAPNSELSDYENIPSPSFNFITGILERTYLEVYNEDPHQTNYIGQILMDLLLSIGVVLSHKGIDLPPPPKIIYVDGTGINRWVEEGQPIELLPFVQLSHAVAKLPEPLFRHCLSRAKYNCGINAVFHDPAEGETRDIIHEYVKRWAVIPNYALTAIRVTQQEDVEEFQELVKQINLQGNRIAEHLKSYLIAERKLVMNRK